MRRTTAALTALLIALGLTLVVAGPASASITSPANGATISGNVTVTDSGASNSGNFYCGDGNMYVHVYLVNSSNVVVATLINVSGSAASGSKSATLVTRNYPNGAYKLRSEVRNVVKSGFGGFGCGTSTSITSRNVTIHNSVSIAYNGALAAPRNTTAPVSARVTDASIGGLPVAGVTVTFTLSAGGGTINDVTDSNGVASANLPVSGSARVATLDVSTPGNSHYAGGSISRTFDVTRNSTATTIAPTSPVVHGQPVSFSASVVATNGTGTPGGTVQFTLDGDPFGSPVTLVGGAASTPATTSLGTGAHTVGASYSGDAGFLPSAATTRTQQVDKASTTTALDAAPSPTRYGQQVTFTATVDVVAPGAGTPTGGVQFNVDGAPYGTAVPLSGDTATLSISNLSTGNHQVDATYNGDADFASSSSGTLTQGVDKADANLALSTSDASAVSGQPLTFTADVTAVGPGAGTPTGTVQFYVDGDPLGAPVSLAGGSATSPTAHLVVGAHLVTADYAGDANFGGAQDDLTQQVAQAATSTTVTTAPNPSVFGQPVALHAVVAPVAPGTGTPTGTVQFFVDGVASGQPVALVDGETAPYAVSTLSRGSHTVTATYLGDVEFAGSDSAGVTQVVNKAATKVGVVSSAPTSVFGQPVTLTATVSVLAPGAGAPSGTITFKDGTTVLDTVPVDSGTGEQASVTTSALSVGQHAIVAEYSGDDSFLGASGSTTQKVQRAQTSTLVTSSANPARTGQAVTFTAQVAPVAPGAGLPTGTVLFTVNGATLGGPIQVVGGQASSPSFASLTPGTYTVQASYSGDGNFVGSAGLLDQGAGQDVTKGATVLDLASGPDPALYGEPVTFTATVSAVAPATGHPSGVVRFWEGGVLLGASSLAPTDPNAAAATFVSSTLAPGEHAIRAEYVGNFNFDGSTATTSQTVLAVSTVTGLESSANPSAFGDPVTLTAVVSPTSSSVGDATGTVTFTEGATVLGTGTLATVDGRRVAAITVTGLAAGTHTVQAAYSGSATFASSTSAPFDQQVDRVAPLLRAGAPTVNGQVTATLTGVGGVPLAGETIAFWSAPSDGLGKHLCDAVTDANGVASCDETVINVVIGGSFDGAYTARFAGNASYLPAQSGATQF